MPHIIPFSACPPPRGSAEDSLFRNRSIRSLGQVAEDLVHQLGLGEDDHPGREEDEPGVRPDVHVFLVPHLQRALVGRDDLGVCLVKVHALRGAFRKQGFLVAEHHRADAGEARLHVVDLLLDPVRVRRKCLAHKRTRPDDRHVAKEDVEDLRQLVDLRLAQEPSKRQHARIAVRRVQTACHVRRVAEHRRELEDLEVAILVADPVLSVEDVVLARALEDDHHGDQERTQHEDGEPAQHDRKESLHVPIHTSPPSSRGIVSSSPLADRHARTPPASP